MPGIAVQLWTVRDSFDRDPEGVLRRVAALGYAGFELVHARTGGISHQRQAEICDDAGLEVAAMHCFFNEIDDELSSVIEAAHALGVRDVVCAWMDPRHRANADSYRAAAEILGHAGERMRRDGLQLGYHHHDFELRDVEGRRGIDYLWDVDPVLLKAEVDTYWVYVAGLDVAQYVASLGERVVLLHCKDRMRDGERPLSDAGEGLARYNREVGEGVVDFPSILAAAKHVQWLITEQDFTDGDPFGAAATSLRNLRHMLATMPT